MQILLRNLLFINYAVAPERVRHLVPSEFNLETRQDEQGNARAFVSAVPFEVAEIRSSSLSMPGLRFNQINYRAYLISPEGAAVYFLGLRVGSRMVAASASFLNLPVSHEDIGLSIGDGTANLTMASRPKACRLTSPSKPPGRTSRRRQATPLSHPNS